MEGREVQTLFLRFAALPSLLLIWRMPQLPDRPLRILVIQFRHVGDVLLTTPALKALRDRYPQARIDYLTEPGPSHILRGNPHIDAVILRKRKATLREDWALIRTLRRTQYDLVFDFFSNPTSAILARLSGAPCRVARSRFGRNFLYSHTPVVNHQEDVYSPTHKLALLRAMGVPAAICPPILEIPRESADRIAQFLQDSAIAPEARLVTMDTTSRLADKKWEGQRFLQLADWLTEKHGARVVFIWGPGEKEEVEDLITQGRHAHLLAPPTSLMELAALIAKSHLHIGNCSGPRHIAVAVGTPTLTIMGPTLPANWTYPSPEHQALRGNTQCPACREQSCTLHHRMEDVRVEDAKAALESMFERGSIR